MSHSDCPCLLSCSLEALKSDQHAGWVLRSWCDFWCWHASQEYIHRQAVLTASRPRLGAGEWIGSKSEWSKRHQERAADHICLLFVFFSSMCHELCSLLVQAREAIVGYSHVESIQELVRCRIFWQNRQNLCNGHKFVARSTGCFLFRCSFYFHQDAWWSLGAID